MRPLLILTALLCTASRLTSAQSSCVGASEFGNLAQDVLARVQELVAPVDADDERNRVAYGYPLVPRNQVSIVTQSATCAKAFAAYQTATSGGAGYSGRVVVVKAGTTYTVVDPGYYWNPSSKAYHWVLMDSKFKTISLIAG